MDIDYYRKYEPFFGSWYIKREIGKGSYGRVFEITRTEFGETFVAALKVISIPPSEEEWDSVKNSEGFTEENALIYYSEKVEKCTKEFVLMSKLKGNSNIVSYEDHIVKEKENSKGWDIFIRMELLTPLFDYMEEHPMDENEVLSLGKDICSALELCEKNGIIHRDIKPENIFISHTGGFKLGDFGIARIAERYTGASTHAGSPNYMAPEIEIGIQRYDNRVDIYSLGIVMYWLMNGKRMPFMPPSPHPIYSKDRDNAVHRRLVGEPMPAPAEASEDFSKIILKACAFNPDERFCSAKEMRIAIEKVGKDANDKVRYFDEKYEYESGKDFDYGEECFYETYRGYYSNTLPANNSVNDSYKEDGSDYSLKNTIEPDKHIEDNQGDAFDAEGDKTNFDKTRYKGNRNKWFIIVVILELLALIVVFYCFVINPSIV